MNPVRPGEPGATRACPHCRETILESAMVCPACRHYLRYGASPEAPSVPALTPLLIEGNVEEATRVELTQSAVVVGDVKSGSLTVVAGARMRGQAEFGWGDDKGSKISKSGNGIGMGRSAS